jgi:nicotinate-nucleotide adenylyltransferase
VLPPLAIDISATDIRARLADGRSVRYLIPGEVSAHIEKYGLYR